MDRAIAPLAAILVVVSAVFIVVFASADPVPYGPAVAGAVILVNLALFSGAALHVLLRTDLAPARRMRWLLASGIGAPFLPVGALGYIAFGPRSRLRTILPAENS